MKNIKTLKIYGRRWFQKSYGNTYHTTTVIINGEEIKGGNYDSTSNQAPLV